LSTFLIQFEFGYVDIEHDQRTLSYLQGYLYTAISIKVVHKKSGKVEYERERLLGIAKKLMNFHPRADGAKRRARVLIPPGYLHPGKRKH
jgi:hypothetical protein